VTPEQPLAYMDPHFLDSDEARPIRILAEYLEPLRRLKAQNIQDTVVFFGSARVHSRQHAARAVARIRQRNNRRGPEYSAALSAAARRSNGRATTGARAIITAGAVESFARVAMPPLRRVLRRRAGHHGSGEPRRGQRRLGFNIRLPFGRANRYITGLHFSSTTSSCASSGSPISPRH
jgi:hypothetical protein